MKVLFVGAGPGDPELLTLKGRRALETCGCCIYAGSLINPEILNALPPGAERHDSAALSLEDIQAIYRRAKEEDVDVVRLHSGDPSLYGAMGEQMRELEGLDVAYEVIPGVSAFMAAAAAIRTPLTSAEVNQTVVLSRLSGRTPVPASQELERLAQLQATLCIFLSVARIDEIANRLSQSYGLDCPACVVYHATWPDQKIVRGTLEDIAFKVHEAGILKTALILVGRALARPDTRSKLYDAGFSHEFRKGSGT